MLAREKAALEGRIFEAGPTRIADSGLGIGPKYRDKNLSSIPNQNDQFEELWFEHYLGLRSAHRHMQGMVSLRRNS
jgi:hypothetical protein